MPSSPNNEVDVLGQQLRDCSGVVLNDIFYQYGPMNRQDLWAFDLNKEKWSVFKFKKSKTTISTQKAHSMVAQNGKIYIIGGKGSGTEHVNCYLLKVFMKGCWETKNHLSFPILLRSQIYTLMLFQKFCKTTFPFPKFVLYLVFQFMSCNI